MDTNKISAERLDLAYLKLKQEKSVYYQLSPAALIELAILNGEGKLADSGAFAADTGEFTGRSPKDRFIVYDDITSDTVWWGDINIPMSPDKFDALYARVSSYLSDKDIYVRDCYACAAEQYRMDIGMVSETAYQNLFSNNLFLRPEQVNPASQPEWTIVTAPGFLAEPVRDGTRQHNFSIIN
ncbi:MAG TPA: phosphoenolpyruvate carboxykinase (ATP), partial [Daejeonella sp.]|nr:phosphoenolpyruvate carboxykinase (ATP) [Daejeonella sp.]